MYPGAVYIGVIAGALIAVFQIFGANKSANRKTHKDAERVYKQFRGYYAFDVEQLLDRYETQIAIHQDYVALGLGYWHEMTLDEMRKEIQERKARVEAFDKYWESGKFEKDFKKGCKTQKEGWLDDIVEMRH